MLKGRFIRGELKMEQKIHIYDDLSGNVNNMINLQSHHITGKILHKYGETGLPKLVENTPVCQIVRLTDSVN